MAVELTDANFETLVKNSGKTVVVDFWAQWCPPCINIIGPAIDAMANEFEGKAIIGKLDVDNNPGVSLEYGVRNIPTVLFFKNGELVDKQVGAVPKSALIKKLEAHL